MAPNGKRLRPPRPTEEARPLWRSVLYNNQKLGDDDVRRLLKHIPRLHREIARWVLEERPSTANLLAVMLYVPRSAKRAWRRMLGQGCRKEDLLFVLRYVPSLRAEARRLLLPMPLTREDRHYLNLYAPSPEPPAEEAAPAP